MSLFLLTLAELPFRSLDYVLNSMIWGVFSTRTWRERTHHRGNPTRILMDQVEHLTAQLKQQASDHQSDLEALRRSHKQELDAEKRKNRR
jgi:hypothetical protein